jgi:hypothetical protein
MNDFTKEELQKLRDGLNYAVGNPYGFTADSIIDLYKKIQSMIDNYCEHWCTHSYREKEYDICLKCGSEE